MSRVRRRRIRKTLRLIRWYAVGGGDLGQLHTDRAWRHEPARVTASSGVWSPAGLDPASVLSEACTQPAPLALVASVTAHDPSGARTASGPEATPEYDRPTRQVLPDSAVLARWENSR